LYSVTKGQQAIHELAGAMRDRAGNLPSMPGIFPDYSAPIVRNHPEGETTNDVFAFLTTEPNKLVGAIHPKAMPAILTTREQIDIWMTAPPEEALKLQRPLPDDALMIVGRGEKKDEGGFAA
jgi:putative SOS response-associated peptidase YedK